LSYCLFVRDFAPETDATTLENLFSEVGSVRKVTLTERPTKGVPRPVALIEMSTPEAMQDCIERFHGMKTDGYTLTVTENKVHVPDPNFTFKKPTQVARTSNAKS
jgi:RNA recognition motif-containing protein